MPPMQMSTLVRAREAVFKSLGRWLTQHGGSIHEALALGTSPTLKCRSDLGGDLSALQTGPAVSMCACRGVLARTDIPASREALITLPSDLFFTPHAASDCLQKALSTSSLAHIEVSTLFLERPQ